MAPLAKNNCFTLALNHEQSERLLRLCQTRGFEPYAVNYADFAFKGNGLNLVKYSSGKLVIQGKNAEEFVKFTIEPEITLQFSLGNDEVLHPDWFEEHAGLDESGKGDFFGPVVTACVIANPSAIKAFVAAGIKDSKKITSDKAILALEKTIRETPSVVAKTMSLSMPKYNELYSKFGSNLNRLLGWMHSRSLANALEERYTERGLLDQFSKNPIVQNFIKKDFPAFSLDMKTKAESDPVVAAASIIARAEYVRAMDKLSEMAGMKLNKGAGPLTIQCGQALIDKIGKERLNEFAKLHFKTTASL